MLWIYYHLQRSCEGYVFTGVCLSMGSTWSWGVLLPGGVLWGDRLGSIYTELITYDAGRAHLCYEFITVCNKVAKVMFLQVCVCSRGVPGPGGVLLLGGVLWGDRLGSIYTELIAYDAGRAHLCYEFITVCNKVAKVMFLQVCVCPRGVPGPGGGGSAPGGCPLRGVPGRGGWYPSMQWGRPPRERRLLLRAVRILLECILVAYVKVGLIDSEPIAYDRAGCIPRLRLVQPGPHCTGPLSPGSRTPVPQYWHPVDSEARTVGERG